MKTIKIVGELTYDDQLMHGDDPESIKWFYDLIIMGDDLEVMDFGDLGDSVGKLKIWKAFE
jgi:hypothetical protein